MAKSWLACEACRQLHAHVVLDTAAPVVSFVAETNAIVTAGWSVTVSGVDFGYADTTPTNELGLSSCPTVAWVSSSSSACYLARGESPLAEALATVSTVVGTQTSVFSYDGRQADQGWHAFGIAFAFFGWDHKSTAAICYGHACIVQRPWSASSTRATRPRRPVGA